MEQLSFDNFKQHALKEYPRECCGVLVVAKGKERYIPCKNISPSLGDFEIDPADYARAEDVGEVVAICHSHPNLTSQPSQTDLTSCELTGKPWYILSIPREHLNVIHPSGYRAPLIGRPYRTNVLDCCTLVQDYYKEVLNIEIKAYDRYDNWWLTEDLLTLDRILDQGFVVVKDLKEHDVIAMSNSCLKGNLNHLAVYLGNERMLHHCSNRLSSKDIYGGYWYKNTRYIVRHKTLC